MKACSTCRGSGWIVKAHESVEDVVPCPDCRSRKLLQTLLQRAAIPPRYLNRGFEEYSWHTKLQERAQLRAIEYVQAFPQVPRGLLFVGPCGVGKTHLSVAILKTLIHEKTLNAKFIDEAELLRRLQYSYGPDSPETERELVLPLLNADLLVWDDLGTGRPTEWVAETIRTIINHRYTYSKQTILSTNWPLKSEQRKDFVSTRSTIQSLPERIGHRLFSRVMEMCEIIELDGPDARTEIHKAGMDFEEKRREQDRQNLDILSCPVCKSQKIDQLDQSKLKQSSKGEFIAISCRCRKCSELFVAHSFSKTKRIAYPSTM